MDEVSGSTGKSTTALDTVHVLTLSVAQYGAAFAASAIVARGLGPAGRGMYYLPLLAASTAVTIGKLGLDQANVFLYGSSRIPIHRLSGQNGLAALLVGGLLAAGLAVLPRAVPSVFLGTPVSLLLLAGLTIPLSIHAQISGALLGMCGAVRRQYAALLTSGIVQACCAAALAVSGLLTVRSAVVIAVIGSGVTWLVIAAALPRDPGSWLSFDRTLLKTTLRSSLVLHAGMILFFLHLRIDMYMVKARLGTAALGEYSVAVTIAEAVMLATDAVAVAVLPTQVENTVRESAERGLRIARVNAIVGGGLACAAAAVSWPAIRLLFGAAYTPAVLPMVVLLPGIAGLGVQRVCGAPLLRAGQTKTIATIYAVTLTLNVVLNLLWIPRFGLVGASLASCASYLIGAGLFLARTARLASLPLRSAAQFNRSEMDALAQNIRSVLSMMRGASAVPRDVVVK